MADEPADVERILAEYPGIIALYRDARKNRQSNYFAEMIIHVIEWHARNFPALDLAALKLYDADCANTVAKEKEKPN